MVITFGNVIRSGRADTGLDKTHKNGDKGGEPEQEMKLAGEGSGGTNLNQVSCSSGSRYGKVSMAKVGQMVMSSAAKWCRRPSCSMKICEGRAWIAEKQKAQRESGT